jgi:hypothetical protein
VNLGHWDKAIIKSLTWVGFGLLVMALFSTIPTTVTDSYSLAVSFLMFFGVYLLVSIVGWLIVGFPTHWLICKFTNASYFYYIAVAILIALILYALISQDSILFSLTAFSQAVVFRFYVYRKT